MKKHFYYTSKATQEFISSNAPRIYLYGSTMGVSNFGDIIQLKNTIHYCRTVLGVEPVVFLLAFYLEDQHHAQLYRKQYDCEHIVFMSEKLVNPGRARLNLLMRASKGGLLYVYGGGFLNKTWGKGNITRITDIIETFEVSDYVFSGEQVDEEVIPVLEELFANKKPLLFGARDYESQRIMEQTSVGDVVRYSFDDVIELFENWREGTRVNIKTKIINTIRPKSILWHFNFSYYSGDKEQILDTIKSVKNKYEQKRPIIAHAWADLRSHRIMDGIAALVQFKEHFPYTDYRVINFARLAYQINPRQGYYPRIGEYIDSIDMCISSSYHITMLLMMFDIPAYLTSTNEYYSQKQKGLGIDFKFKDFVDNPHSHVISLSDKIQKRKIWLKELNEILLKAQQKTKLTPKVLYRDSDIDIQSVPKIEFFTSLTN